MTQQTGKITEVHIEPTGNFLAADVLSSATVLFVDDAYDFSALGGTLTVAGGADLAYVSVDYEADSITLAAPIGVAASRDDPVLVTPGGYTKWAMIDFEDNDQGIQAVIPTGVSMTMADGIRDPNNQETAICDDTSGRWEVVSVNDEVPIVQADNIDSATLLADLNADLDNLNTVILPGISADLAAMEADIATLNGLFPITTTSIANDAITTPKMTANSINGDRITANTLNASKIVAGSITTDRMTVNSIDGDRILANTIAVNKLVANFVDGQVVTGANIRTAASGQRIVLRNDGSGGVLEAFTGVSGEATPATFDPLLAGLQPGLVIASGTSSSYGSAAGIGLLTGAGVSTINLNSTTINCYGLVWADLGIHVNNGYANGTGITLFTGGHISGIGNLHMNGSATFDNTLSVTAGLITNPTHPTTTAAISCHLNASGIFYRNTSLRSSKLNIADVPLEQAMKILEVSAHTWIDKTAAEGYAAELHAEIKGKGKNDRPLPTGIPLTRIPGMIVDEVLDAGVPEMIIWDEDGVTPTGLAYDRLVAYLIPVVKHLLGRIETLEEENAA